MLFKRCFKILQRFKYSIIIRIRTPYAQLLAIILLYFSSRQKNTFISYK